MERKKQRISDLFYDNRFLLVFSVIFALIAWLIVATEFAETQNTISNVPVQINYSNANYLGGLQPFLDKQYTVDVTISGKRYIVESDDIKDDILVVADTSLVNSPGDFPLTLSVTSKSVRPEYEFVSVTPQVTDKITFDYYREDEFKVVPEISFNNNSVDDGFYMGDVVADIASVTISGPETAFGNVAYVAARADYEGRLRHTTTVPATLIPVDKNGDPVQGVTIGRNSSKVNIQVPVYSKHTLPVTCSFSDIPTEYIGNIPFEFTVSPSEATFGIFDEEVEKKSVEFSSKIDFNELKVGENKIEIEAGANEFSGVILLDEDITKFIVTVHVSDMSSKKINMNPDNIRVDNLPSDLNVEFYEFETPEITVIGPKDKLASLNSDNIALIADFDSYETDESGMIKVSVRLTDGYCWSLGDYKALYKPV